MMDNSPLVSILSPTYNHEKFITDCITSVLDQTYQHWEMLILDDGSTDQTLAIAKRFAEKNNRIRVFTQKNIGIFRLGETYNLGLQHAQGKYIAILECDDLWYPDKLEIQIGKMEEHPQCVYSWGKAYLSSIDLSKKYYLAPRNMQDISAFNNNPTGTFLSAFYRTLIPALTIVIRKEALQAIGGFRQGFELPLVDIPTTLELLMKGEFVFIDHPLGQWRIYPHQVTKTYNGQMTLGHYALVQSLMKRYPDIFEAQKITKKYIDKHFHSSIVISYSRSGRYRLIRKDFKGARKDYWYSIVHYWNCAPVWKIRSLTGIVFSIFGMDVEWLAKLIGNESYKD